MKFKVIPILSLVVGIAALSISCSEKDYKADEILYPETGIFGDNLLRNSSTEIVLSTDSKVVLHSFRAELPENSSLKIVIKNVRYTNWSMAGSNGWIKKVENANYLTFDLICYAYGPVVCDGGVRFDVSGSNIIEFYENNSIETTRKKEVSY
jgi:hypothetical protein